MKTKIDAIIDSREAYAYAFMTSNNGYGHMNVTIRMVNPQLSSRANGTISISCQIGSDFGSEKEFCLPYARRYGFQSGSDQATLEEVELATKVLRKIRRHMDKVEELDGPPDDYADFCHRILIGSGVKDLIAEPMDGWVAGGRMCDKELFRIGGASKAKLKQMEANLIGRFSRKAA